MYCSNCGKEIGNNVKVCPYCGTRTSLWDQKSEPQKAPDQSTADPTAASQAENTQSTEAAKSDDIQANDQEPAATSSANADQNAQKTQPDTETSDNTNGTDATGTSASAAAASQSQPVPEVHPSPTPTSHPSGDKRKIIIGAVAAVAILSVIGIALSNRKTKINLNDYVTLSASGYDSLGTAGYSFDYDKFNEDYADKLKLSSNDLQDMVKLFLDEDIDPDDLGVDEIDSTDLTAEVFSSFMSEGSLDKDSDLSNGDVVTYQWNADTMEDEDTQKMLDILGVKASYSDIQMTVDSLEEVNEVDPFEDLIVSFDGIAPNAQCTIANNSSDPMLRQLNYDIDKSENLSNGDQVTVTVNATDLDYYVSQYGEIPSPVSKTYTVDGLAAYITSADDLPDDVLQGMKESVENYIQETAVEPTDDPVYNEEIRSIDYLGNYFLSRKPSLSGGSNNEIYLVYKVYTENIYENATDIYDKINSYYTYCYYEDLLKAADGTVNYDKDNFQVVDNQIDVAALGKNAWNYKGYDSLESLKNRIVANGSSAYDIENTVQDTEKDLEPSLTNTIPENAKECNGHLYEIFNVDGIEWETAKEHCKARGGHLAAVTSDEEEQFLRYDLNPGYTSLWLGGYVDKSGSWKWVTDEKWDYTDWYEDEASEGDTDKYLCMDDNGQWRSETYGGGGLLGNNVQGYICEWDSKTAGAAEQSDEAVTKSPTESATEAATEATTASSDEAATETATEE